MKKTVFLIIIIILIFGVSPRDSFSQSGHEHHDHSLHSDANKKFYLHGGVKLHFDSIVEAHEKKEEVDEASTHSHFELGYNLNKNFSIFSDIKIEGESSGHTHGGSTSTKDPEDKFFEDHKLFVNELVLNFFTDSNINLYLGKFSPSVGFDYHIFPGMYGYQKIEEYAITERLGYGLMLNQNFGDFGTHKFNISTFFKDTTSLSNSIINDRGKTKKSDGGVSNTQDFSSYAVSLEGKNFFSLTNNFIDGFSYKIGHAKQAKGVKHLGSNAANVSLTNDEKRSSFSLAHSSLITSNLRMKIISEYMNIEHYTGEELHDRAYMTTGIDLLYKKINIGGTYTQETNEAAEEDEAIDDKVYQVSLGYLLSKNLRTDIGYKKADEENEIKHTVGALITYYLDF